MWKQLTLAVVCATVILAGSGIYFRSSLDAISSASVNDPRFPKDRLHGIYVMGVRNNIPDLEDGSLKDALKSALEGASPDLSGMGTLSFFFPSGDQPLSKFVKGAAEHLRNCGAGITLRELSPVMLRSRAIAGKFDIFLAPSRLILRSDIARLGLAQIKAEDMKGWGL